MIERATANLAYLQIGKEETRGTLVPATRIHAYNIATFGREVRMNRFDRQLSGSLARYKSRPAITRRLTPLILEEDLTFENVLLPLISGVQGGVTPAQLAEGVYRWRFAPSLTDDPNIETFSCEYIQGSGHNLRAAFKAPYFGCTDFEIRVGEGQPPVVTSLHTGRRYTIGEPTSGLVEPTLSYANSANYGMYDDSETGVYGTTIIPEQLLSLRVRFTGFIYPEYIGDPRQDRDFSHLAVSGERVLDVRGEIAVNLATDDFLMRHEDYKYTNLLQTVRRLRFFLAGSPLSSGFTNSLWIDAPMVHDNDSLVEISEDDIGRSIIFFHMYSIDDGVQDVAYTVTNGLESYL